MLFSHRIMGVISTMDKIVFLYLVDHLNVICSVMAFALCISLLPALIVFTIYVAGGEVGPKAKKKVAVGITIAGILSLVIYFFLALLFVLFSMV